MFYLRWIFLVSFFIVSSFPLLSAGSSGDPEYVEAIQSFESFQTLFGYCQVNYRK